MTDDELDIDPIEPATRQRGIDWGDRQFRLRVLSAVILAPLVLVAVAYGGLPFYTLILLAAIFMMREWDSLTTHRENPAWGLAGVVYVTLMCLAIIRLREETLDGSLSLVLYLLAVVWATDIGAFFAGKQIGGPKLAPTISPNKTWAGLLGGVISAVAIGGLLGFFFPFPYTFMQAAWIGALLAVVAQLGDLFESWLKRSAGKKDSGRLIPGHGGILDRVDGLVFTAPLLALLHIFLAAPVE